MVKILLGTALVGAALFIALGSPAPDAGPLALLVGGVGVVRCSRRRKVHRGRMSL